jgi:hypothetical protein
MQTINETGKDLKQKPGVPCIETRLLADLLMASESNVVNYEALSGAIGQSVQGKARGYLLTARDIVLREKGMVFRPLRNIGLMRLAKSDVTKLDDRRLHARRTHRKALREHSTVSPDQVSPDEWITNVAKCAFHEMNMHTHDGKRLKQIEQSIRDSPQHQLNLKATLQLFAGEAL